MPPSYFKYQSSILKNNSTNSSTGSVSGGARRTRSTRCWRRGRRNGTRYTVCNKSKGQKRMYKRKTAKKRRGTLKKSRSNRK